MKLSIEKIVYGGAGIASGNEGKTVFVPFTLPGEQVEAEITAEHGNRHEAAVVHIQTPSSERISPRCIHFERCGGCQYQHASYPAELQIKREILQETLERAGLDELPPIETHATEPWEYRNRIRLRTKDVEGRLRVGYLRRGSIEFLPIEMCPISAPVLWRAAEAFTSLAEDFPLWTRATEEVEFFSSEDERKLQMTLFLRTQPAKGFAEFCEAVQRQLPELVGAGVQAIENMGRGRKSLRTKPGVTWGAAGLQYATAGETYWVSRGNFFQVNRRLVSQLAELVTTGRNGKLAWDLYAGVGLFARILTRQFTEVVAVEAAADDLATNLRGFNARTVAATTVEFLRQAALERDRPDLIVMDPPRAGIGGEVSALLSRIKAPEMIYVSCDPTTLGRDLRQMIDSGYKLNQLHLVDMFPRTFHQETMAVLVPGDRG